MNISFGAGTLCNKLYLGDILLFSPTAVSLKLCIFNRPKKPSNHPVVWRDKTIKPQSSLQILSEDFKLGSNLLFDSSLFNCSRRHLQVLPASIYDEVLQLFKFYEEVLQLELSSGVHDAFHSSLFAYTKLLIKTALSLEIIKLNSTCC